MTAPVGSVIETIVLLNVLLMCAWPWATFFRSLRRTFLAAAAVRLLGGMRWGLLGEVVGPWGRDPDGCYFLPGFFLPAMARRGPLRVRALVCVRWPRTGRPRRCRRPW